MPEGLIDTLMVIGAHHDDNELVAGTLAAHRSKGWRIVSVVMTDGRWIRNKISEQHIAIRERESLASAELLGIECVFLRFTEGKLEANFSARTSIIQEIRKYRPRIVITHPRPDYHLDHETTSRLVEEAVLQTWNSCVETDSPPCESPQLYFSDAWFVPFQPDEYVDITRSIDLKLRMLACHESQLPETGQSDSDMLAMARLQSQFRGVEASVRFAEAFRLVPKLGRVRCHDRLIPS